MAIALGAGFNEESADGHYTSMTDLLAEVRILLRDPSASGGRWTDTELYTCIRQSLRGLSGIYYTEALVFTPDSTEREYILPRFVRSILSVDMLPTQSQPVPILSRRFDWHPAGGILTFYEYQTDLYEYNVRYLRELEIPPIPDTLGSDLTTNATVVDLTGASIGWPGSQGLVRIGDEYISYLSLSGGNLRGCARGVLGSTVATHVASTIVDPVMMLGAKAREATLRGAQMHAHLMRLEDGPQGDNAGELTRANLARQDYEEYRDEAATAPMPSAQLPTWRRKVRHGRVVS